MDTLLCKSDGDVIFFGAPSATDEVLAFHYGNFDNHYGDGTVGAAAANGRVYADTVPATLPAKFGTIGTPSTASGQTTYTWTPPPTSLQANVLVVAGGGGGGGFGGGGGAGGVLLANSLSISAGAHTIKVGKGGVGKKNSDQVNGENGFNSQFDSATAVGGGGGGTRASNSVGRPGSSGGSGGGGSHGNSGAVPLGGASTQGTATGFTAYGNSGGYGRNSTSGGNPNHASGGGGGAGGAGGNYKIGTDGRGADGGGDGGAGFLVSVFGETYGESGWFAGGGGGNIYRLYEAPGIGGVGGGGNGGCDDPNIDAQDGDAHTGGGGGGGRWNNSNGLGGNGGSGIVAIRYIVDTTVLSSEEVGAFDILGSSVSSTSLGTYSLRRIFNTYTGPQVRVRRSTDNVETDIYFDKYGSMINFNLTTWLGGGTAYVRTWYDQSGNNNDITQTDTASQPILTAPIGERAYIRFQGKLMSGPNVFGTSTITNMHMIFTLRENVRNNNYFVSLNGVSGDNPGRFFVHAPYGNGRWYWDPGSVTPDRASGATSILGAKTVFSGYKSTINGFRLNGGTRYLSSGSTTATVTGGVLLGTGATDHSIYDLFIFSSQLSDYDESFIEWNAA